MASGDQTVGVLSFMSVLAFVWQLLVQCFPSWTDHVCAAEVESNPAELGGI